MRADMALVEWPGTRYVIGIVTEGDTDTRFWAENTGDRLIGRVSRLIVAAASAADATAGAIPEVRSARLLAQYSLRHDALYHSTTVERDCARVLTWPRTVPGSLRSLLAQS